MEPQTSKPDKAFVKLHSWQRAYTALANALGVKINDGTQTTLADGSTAFRFNDRFANRPFGVSRGNGVIVNAGLLFWGGRTYYFPRNVIQTSLTSWTCGLRLRPTMVVAANAPGDPWDIHAAFAVAPVLEVNNLGTVGTNMAIEDLNDAIITALDENLVVTNGDVLWPLANCIDGRVIPYWSGGHISLESLPNGRLIASAFWSPS